MTDIQAVSIYSLATSRHVIGWLRLEGPFTKAGVTTHWHHPAYTYSVNTIRNSDLVIIQRDFPRMVQQFVDVLIEAAKYNKPIVFEIDDLLWDLSEFHPDRQTHYYTPALFPMLFALQEADAVITASAQLKNILESFNPNIKVIPNFLNEDQWVPITPQLNADNKVIIGYVGGDSHLPDLKMVAPVIKKTLTQHQGKVKFEVYGLMPPDDILVHPDVTWVPLKIENYSDFAQVMQAYSFDIFIAPLEDNLFNRCKSAIKYLECTSLAAAGVCSRIPPYSEIIEDGVTGLLVSTEQEWEAAINRLILDPEYRFQMVVKAQKALYDQWLLGPNLQKFLNTYSVVHNTCIPSSRRSDRARFFLSVMSQYQAEQTAIQAELQSAATLNHQLNALEMEISRLKNRRILRATAKLNRLFQRLKYWSKSR